MSNPHPVSRQGKPNKFGEQRAGALERSGKKLPPASLLLISENLMAMAARYQPELTDPATGERRANPNFIEERYAFWLDRACDALAKAAPYYSPKLHAIAIAKPPSEDDKIGRVDPRQQMWETYKAMRERGEIAMKTIGSTGNGASPDTPAAEPAVAVEDDDGDGVAA